jgi:RimJ/RimL family protein N-acetyltransferase
MTFYNIIFGILFFGAFREVISSLAAGPRWDLFCQTATLSVLIFSDTIYTAVIIEGKGQRYSIWMKLVDLLSFIWLSLAVVVVDPKRENMFQVDSQNLLALVCGNMCCKPEAIFWALLTLYTINLIIWNTALRIYRNLRHHRWIMLIQPLMAILFGAMAVLSYLPDRGEILDVARPTIAVLSLIYLVGYKPFVTKVLDAIVLEPLNGEDAHVIRFWPPYPARATALDYALRPGGWLDSFPASDTSHRWAAWHDGKLVGFSILTGNSKTEAEFYIALHPERLGEGFGRRITEQTVDLGFKTLGLKRIYLKVRDWYTEAIRLYESVGFKKYGTHVENIQGQPVDFIMMERMR